MYGTHGSWCNTRTFPLTCKYCSSRIFFFRCDHESRVLFDSLGWPWPLHDCLTPDPPPSPNPTDADIFQALQGVQFSVRNDKTSGLLPGMKLFNGSVDEVIATRVGSSESATRDTVRIDPLGGEETHIGLVTHLSEVSLESRFIIASESIGARLIAGMLGGLTAVQITILVDEIASDPDALDLMSYTFWSNPKLVPKGLSESDVISVTFAPADLAAAGRRWVASGVELLI